MSSNPKFQKPLWHLIDARGQIVGRLASQITTILRGKHKPNFCPNYDCSDYVVIINAKEIRFTGNKLNDKYYRWHTGYPGGLKEINVKNLLERKPEEVLRRAILGMMPKNTLRNYQATKLKIFPGEKHLHEDMLPPGTKPINV